MNGVISPHDEEEEQCQPCSNSVNFIVDRLFQFLLSVQIFLLLLFPVKYCFSKIISQSPDSPGSPDSPDSPDSSDSPVLPV